MRLLVLGGTAFLGRAVARHARDAGHDVTCAARGRGGPPAAGVRFVRVDRAAAGGLAGLAGERFDAVVDVARLPSHVAAAVAALGDRVRHWVYVSTCSVYADDATPNQLAAAAPVLPPAPPGTDLDDADPEGYGRNKLACERAVIGAVGADRAMLCRAGLIVGPEDPSGRFEYWVRRVARGGEVLAPGRPSDPVQLVDVRDLAGWLVQAAATGLAGTYDGMGPPMPRADFLAALAAGARVEPVFTWVDQEFLVEREVRPWMGPRSLPLWLPLPGYAGFLTRDPAPSLAAGLRLRPLPETAADTGAWLAGQPDAVDRCGLTAVDEADVLRQWHGRPRTPAGQDRRRPFPDR
jgi:nucleoside-diphosphate-sugar epimerase